MKLYLPEKFTELGDVVCKEPIYIDIYYIDRKAKAAHFAWDFGMDSVVGLDNYFTKHIKKVKDKILKEIIFDVGHAFFHYNGDPNYTHYHWALYAWLKDRIETKEYEFQPRD